MKTFLILYLVVNGQMNITKIPSTVEDCPKLAQLLSLNGKYNHIECVNKEPKVKKESK